MQQHGDLILFRRVGSVRTDTNDDELRERPGDLKAAVEVFPQLITFV